MIISHKYRFIFIKTNKTAGTSIEIALSKFCSEKDIITRISPEDEKIRQQLAYRGPQNHTLPFTNYSYNHWLKSLCKMKWRKIDSHSSAYEIRKIIDEDIWNDYYKFCFERNPWDRVISLYYWYHKTRPLISFSDFLDSEIPQRLKKRGIENYTIDGKIVVDRVCLYENMEQELEAVCNQQLGIPEKLVLPRAKGNFRADRRHYREILNDEDRDRIAKMFADEISLFNYEY